MNEVELTFCKNFTKKLIKCELTIAFASPIDRNADWAPDYFRIIEHPMDLSTIENKLEDSEYKTVEEWRSDINLIWKNAMTFNKKPSPLFYVADFLQKKCDKNLAIIPRTENDVLMIRLEKANRRMTKLLAFDAPEQSSVPRVDPASLRIKK
ncbi:Bromodomain containing protein [Tritrichomonas foetus]|uniref:Bromodomain containing protein n=1 Tax=Tritrichomonas foetus TaxID=1144522 RepID=A0A1J4J9K0_9EUKA|nr:Bromodomain containing protein [Tritrichomonas foetus]|eukprot:OHS94903.1 Bromodomain containing protein [Tritrichomonas foetus]